MADTKWFQMKSWHAVERLEGSEWVALCGRRVGAAALIYDNLGSTKSCESCLRILARKQDR